ncbi:hypothetical protein C672_1096 [[Clostridium] bifermentans ATCC 638]|uniref:Uncharacterized protein n=1 Tax=Paraclostridium bifermentans ATCC 638 = DSM 14991 TaxID=1233171 RepID=T4VEL8_PARBF|nr:hypothetical protein [Paraclostridium bifermentans]EQK42154.1 hypothetical protein C672_1096 [[Clostridium] bifermentans ATCC 638] [Paraclostridium bifermentans ATCC 638 = DSM 14991]RIZ58909.1 hypothetical protein CHH45_09390 [Paraclostridium bifermentans]UAG19017.1 hypothetical protein KXZ80_04715 [Paraclostridium bifermentans]
MNNENKYSIDNISKNLIENYRAVEITLEDFLNMDENNEEYSFEDISKIYKIDNLGVIEKLLSEEEKTQIELTIEHLNNIDNEDSSYLDKISTGQLIIIVLESKDKVNLSGFIMEGNGQVLFDYLTSLIGNDVKKEFNKLDEIIEELKEFKPYGKYFK